MADMGMQTGMELRQGITLAMRHSLQILQANSMELHELVTQALNTNPVLEQVEPDYEGKKVESEREMLAWDCGPTVSLQPVDESNRQFMFDSYAEEESLVSHLLQQLHTSGVCVEVKRVVEYLIRSLDEKGFFSETREELIKSSPFTEEEIDIGLDELHSYDPYGIGAFDKIDSLLIQLEQMGLANSDAAHIVKDYLPELAHHQYEKIAHKLDISMEDVKLAEDDIKLLSPYPAARFDGYENHVVIPDVEVFHSRRGWDARLIKENIPQLKLSDYYKQELAKSAGQKELRAYLKKCFSEARQLMQSIDLRQETLLRLAQFLVIKQQDFFEKGRQFLKPLGMAEVAETLGVHHTTISRAVSGKYLICVQGIFDLRFFFSSGYESSNGEQVSKRSILDKIVALVSSEETAKPLSDNEISKILEKQGLSVARRTVAKYRLELNILPASQRKRS